MRTPANRERLQAALDRLISLNCHFRAAQVLACAVRREPSCAFANGFLIQYVEPLGKIIFFDAEFDAWLTAYVQRTLRPGKASL